MRILHGFVALVCVFLSGGCLKQPSTLARLGQVSDTDRYIVPVGASPFRGERSAPVTIVEFTDFQCGPCRAAARMLDWVRARYGDSVRVVFKNRPLDNESLAEVAAELAFEARAEKGDDAFWVVYDRLWDSYDDLSIDKLSSIGKESDLSPERMKLLFNGRLRSGALRQDVALADKLVVKATPQLFINGRRVIGLVESSRLEAMVDQELTNAKALVARGVASESVYDELQKGAKESP